jgi:hypothetical protein
LLGCADRAEPEYAKCVQSDIAGDVAAAWAACNTAIAADPTSDSGKAAATKLAALKPKYEAWQKAEAEKAQLAAVEKKKKDEAAAAAQKEAQERALRLARLRVERRYYNHERDGECIDKGLPDYRWDYEGGTRDEIDLVASDYGCKHLFENAQDFLIFKVFCCPQQ